MLFWDSPQGGDDSVTIYMITEIIGDAGGDGLYLLIWQVRYIDDIVLSDTSSS